MAPVASVTFSSLCLFEGFTDFCVRLQVVLHRKLSEPCGEGPGEHAIHVAADLGYGPVEWAPDERAVTVEVDAVPTLIFVVDLRTGRPVREKR